MKSQEARQLFNDMELQDLQALSAIAFDFHNKITSLLRKYPELCDRVFEAMGEEKRDEIRQFALKLEVDCDEYGEANPPTLDEWDRVVRISIDDTINLAEIYAEAVMDALEYHEYAPEIPAVVNPGAVYDAYYALGYRNMARLFQPRGMC